MTARGAKRGSGPAPTRCGAGAALLIGLLVWSGAPAVRGQDSGLGSAAQSPLRQGADVPPEAASEASEHPLHTAILAGDAQALQRTLESGADLEDREEHGRTPLYSAAREGRAEWVLQLLASGARSNAINYAGLSPLHIAAARGHADAVRVLLANCADLEARDLLERTPLLLAATRGHADIVEMLLREGADPTARRDSGSTALSKASAFREFEVAALLRDYARAALAAERALEEREPESENAEDPGEQSREDSLPVPPLPSVASPPPVLPQRATVPRLSGERERVLFAQEKLTALGYSPGPVDGSLAERTRAAIRTFQLDVGQVQDGELSPCLLQRLATEDLLRQTPPLVFPEPVPGDSAEDPDDPEGLRPSP